MSAAPEKVLTRDEARAEIERLGLPVPYDIDTPPLAQIVRGPLAKSDAYRILEKGEAKLYKWAGYFGYSPSQIDEFRLCSRKWFFKSVERVPAKSGAGADLGTECHSIWETWLQTGKLAYPDGRPAEGTKAGKICKATLRFLPLPGVATVEGETKLATPLGILTTRIDFWIPDQGAHKRATLGEMPAPWQSRPDSDFVGVPLIGDHKTTKDIDAYAKRPEDLIGDGTRDVPGDAQATGYGLISHVRAPKAPAIDCFWSYSRTQGRSGALPVRARWDLSSLERALVFLFEDVARMRRYAETLKSANDVPANPHACGAFGGCPFQSRCILTDEERLRSVAGDNFDLSALLDVPAAAPAKPAQPAKVAASAPVDDDPLAASLGIEVAAPAKPAATAPKPSASSSADPLADSLGLDEPAVKPAASPPPAKPVEAPAATGLDPAQATKLAARFFSEGKPLPETAAPEVKAAYAKLVGGANPNPSDAAPVASTAADDLGLDLVPPSPISTGTVTVTVEKPAETPAPSAATEAPAAERPKRARKASATAPAASEKTSEKPVETYAVEVQVREAPSPGDPVALLKAAAHAAIDKGAFRLAEQIANLLNCTPPLA